MIIIIGIFIVLFAYLLFNPCIYYVCVLQVILYCTVNFVVDRVKMMGYNRLGLFHFEPFYIIWSVLFNPIKVQLS